MVRDNVEAYKIAIDLSNKENENFLVILGIFLVFHSIVLGFLLNQGTKIEFNIYVFLVSILGIVSCIPLYSSFSRGVDLRNAFLRKAYNLEPEDWDLIRSLYKFTDENNIIRISKGYKLNILARILNRRNSITLLILMFFLIYLIILLIQIIKLTSPFFFSMN